MDNAQSGKAKLSSELSTAMIRFDRGELPPSYTGDSHCQYQPQFDWDVANSMRGNTFYDSFQECESHIKTPPPVLHNIKLDNEVESDVPLVASDNNEYANSSSSVFFATHQTTISPQDGQLSFSLSHCRTHSNRRRSRIDPETRLYDKYEIDYLTKQERRQQQWNSFSRAILFIRVIRSSVYNFIRRPLMWRNYVAYTALLSDESTDCASAGSFDSCLMSATTRDDDNAGGNNNELKSSTTLASRLSQIWLNDLPPKAAFYRPNGIHWITAALFIVADMAGGGVVAMPIAMLKSGRLVGCLVITVVGFAFCYTAHLLGENWLLMCRRWPTVYGSYVAGMAKDDVCGKDSQSSVSAFAHCRKPYPEMALRSMGPRAQTLTSCCLNVMLYGVSIVYLLLASKIISDFVASAFAIQVGQCSMLLIVSIALLPITFLKSPQDFWWAVVMAMLTTAIAVVLILVGTVMDAPLCAPQANHPKNFRANEFLLSLGIFMFAFGGHGVFPTIQHDMKRPQQFTGSVILAFIMVFAMYIPITLLGYSIYGDSLQESIINSIQIPGIQVAANLCIAIHCILTLTIVINPLNQQFEHMLHVPHHFGWRRVLIRSGVMALIVFSAETVPSFGPILNLIGGTMVALTSAVMPCLFSLFMGARYGRYDKNADEMMAKKEPPIPTITEVIRKTPTATLMGNIFVIVMAIICGATTTWSALIDLASSSFSAPCYLSGASLFAAEHVQPMLCCGSGRNVHRLLLISGLNATEFCAIAS